MQLPPKFQAGFTLIELLIVSTLTIFLVLTVTSIFMTFLLGNAKTNIRQQLKNEGSVVTNRIDFLIRNARTVNCTGPLNNRVLSIVDLDDKSYQFSKQGQRLVLNVNGTPQFLTSEFVVVNSNIVVDCTQNPQGVYKYVEYQFSLSNSDEGTISEIFKSSAQVRN